MDAAELLNEITNYCRSAGLAESTFGKLAVNDGKFVNRLRDGGRITSNTLERIRGFISANPAPADGARPFVVKPRRSAEAGKAEGKDGQKNFRFYDNRQKYLLFVNTCSEK